MAASIGLTLPDKSAPSWLLGGAATVAEAVWRTFDLKGEPPITRHVVMVMKCDCVLDGKKAREELGYVPVISRAAGFAAMKA
jgi:nucleoside-diphosphate-sugar epimerase